MMAIQRTLQRGAFLLFSLLSVTCGSAMGQLDAQGGVRGSGGGGLGAECRGDFGANASARKLEAFLTATNTFVTTANELEGELYEACGRMGRDLEIPEAEMQPTGQVPRVKAACERVAQQIQADMQAIGASGAGIRVDVEATPPVCEVRVDGYARCAGECDASFDPGEAHIECEGGELRGSCTAECRGSCSVQASGSCSGSCEGTCSGGCSGSCQGVCEGTCATRGADGQCNGRCEGTCRGTCTAGCSGSCEGQCVAEVTGSCQGECRGGCSVEFQEPRCTGTVRPPRVEAECQASCDARLEAEAECRPGQARVNIAGGLSPEAEAKAARLRAAFEHGYGSILAAAKKLERLGRAGRAMIQIGGEVPGAVASLGLAAGACATQAVALLPQATAKVTVSVEVSASLSASAGSR